MHALTLFGLVVHKFAITGGPNTAHMHTYRSHCSKCSQFNPYTAMPACNANHLELVYKDQPKKLQNEKFSYGSISMCFCAMCRHSQGCSAPKVCPGIICDLAMPLYLLNNLNHTVSYLPLLHGIAIHMYCTR